LSFILFLMFKLGGFIKLNFKNLVRMKLEKKNIINVLLILGAAILLFTPVGFHFKVLVNRLLSFSPSEIEVEAQKEVGNYDWQLISQEDLATNFENEKGKVVILNMWATWCPPCVAEMPSFQKLYNDYGDKVSFLFVAQDEKQKVSSFLSKNAYTLPVYYENGSRPKVFESNSIPVSYIIGKKGKISFTHTGAADWNSAAIRLSLDALLAE